MRAHTRASLRRFTLVFGCGLAACCCAQVEAAYLLGAGATSSYPLYAKWFEIYERQSGVRILYQPIESGAGLKMLSEGAVDFAASDWPLNDAEARQAGGVVHIATHAHTVAVVYNLQNVRRLNLSGEVLSAIFDGRVTRWPLGGAVSGESVSYLVRGTPGSITVVDWAIAVQNRLSVAAIRNRSGKFVLPSVDAARVAVESSARLLLKDMRAPVAHAPDAVAYPICGLSFIVARKKQPNTDKAHQLRRFLRWASGAGQSFSRPLLYTPLPMSLRPRNRQIIDTIL